MGSLEDRTPNVSELRDRFEKLGEDLNRRDKESTDSANPLLGGQSDLNSSRDDTGDSTLKNRSSREDDFSLPSTRIAYERMSPENRYWLRVWKYLLNFGMILSAVGYGFFVMALFCPVMNVEAGEITDPDIFTPHHETLLHSLWTLYQQGAVFSVIVAGLFSVSLPFLKMIATFVSYIVIVRHRKKQLFILFGNRPMEPSERITFEEDRALKYSREVLWILKLISKFQMVDVVIMLIVMAYLRSAFVWATAERGFFYLVTYCIFSIAGTLFVNFAVEGEKDILDYLYAVHHAIDPNKMLPLGSKNIYADDSYHDDKKRWFMSEVFICILTVFNVLSGVAILSNEKFLSVSFTVDSTKLMAVDMTSLTYVELIKDLSDNGFTPVFVLSFLCIIIPLILSALFLSGVFAYNIMLANINRVNAMRKRSSLSHLRNNSMSLNNSIESCNSPLGSGDGEKKLNSGHLGSSKDTSSSMRLLPTTAPLIPPNNLPQLGAISEMCDEDYRADDAMIQSRVTKFLFFICNALSEWSSGEVLALGSLAAFLCLHTADRIVVTIPPRITCSPFLMMGVFGFSSFLINVVFYKWNVKVKVELSSLSILVDNMDTSKKLVVTPSRTPFTIIESPSNCSLDRLPTNRRYNLMAIRIVDCIRRVIYSKWVSSIFFAFCFIIIIFFTFISFTYTIPVAKVDPKKVQNFLDETIPSAYGLVKKNLPNSVGKCDFELESPPAPCVENDYIVKIDGSIFLNIPWVSGVNNTQLTNPKFSINSDRKMQLEFTLTFIDTQIYSEVGLCLKECKNYYQGTSVCCGNKVQADICIVADCASHLPQLRKVTFSRIKLSNIQVMNTISWIIKSIIDLEGIIEARLKAKINAILLDQTQKLIWRGVPVSFMELINILLMQNFPSGIECPK